MLENDSKTSSEKDYFDSNEEEVELTPEYSLFQNLLKE